MIKAAYFPIALMLLGLVVLAWPERNSVMLVKLAESHGPSALDVVGIVIIMLGYVPLVSRVIFERVRLRSTLGIYFPVSIAVILVAFASIIVGLVVESEWLLWSAVGIATLVQGNLIFLSFHGRA
jgi:hypothetical protein